MIIIFLCIQFEPDPTTGEFSYAQEYWLMRFCGPEPTFKDPIEELVDRIMTERRYEMSSKVLQPSPISEIQAHATEKSDLLRNLLNRFIAERFYDSSSRLRFGEVQDDEYCKRDDYKCIYERHCDQGTSLAILHNMQSSD